MTRNKVIALGGIVVVATLVAGGTRLRSAPSAPEDETIKALATERLTIAREAFEDAARSIVSPPSPDGPVSRAADIERAIDWSRRCMAAHSDLNEDPAERVAALADHIKRLESVEEMVKEMSRGAGSGVSRMEALLARYHVLDARAEQIRASDAAR